MKFYTSKEAYVGNVIIGALNPIRMQSMLSTKTIDIKSSVEQCIELYESGCELIRLSVKDKEDIVALSAIKHKLNYNRGINIPLIADIHFRPDIAEEAAKLVEKVRINPGNYVDKNKNNKVEIRTYLSKEEEQERIYTRLKPLVDICKEHGTAIRIGINQGSLSERITQELGDTEIGMVESAFEYLEILKQHNFYNIVVSLKSSNPITMVNANRLFVTRSMQTGYNYPLHLGVTEAGEGEDGRIKSTVGIATLLNEGIGDTIRVSLTEDSVNEIPVAKKIAKFFSSRNNQNINNATIHTDVRKKRETFSVGAIGGDNVPKVICNYKEELIRLPEDNYDYSFVSPSCLHNVFVDNKLIYTATEWYKLDTQHKYKILPLFNKQQYLKSEARGESNLLNIQLNELDNQLLDLLANNKNTALIFNVNSEITDTVRSLYKILEEKGLQHPIIFKRRYTNLNDIELLQVKIAGEWGGLFLDGFGNGLWIDIKSSIPTQKVNEICLGVLQAARVRIVKTEYIACPSCGRTTFDIQKTLQAVKQKTSHYKGIKIAVMGCVVNGIGEMADADYGYVGTGTNLITLYRHKEVVKRNIEEEYAVEELVKLIEDDLSK